MRLSLSRFTPQTRSFSTVKLERNLKPSEVVVSLDDYVVGQAAAKRAVAIALRNRWRRHLLPEQFQNDVIPKNILMVGPTGCGKTEIARRLSLLSKAPFIKVEATKYTEVGYHGKDVDQIIKDLMEISIKMVSKQHAKKHTKTAIGIADEKILTILRGSRTTKEDKKKIINANEDEEEEGEEEEDDDEDDDEDEWMKALKAGELDDNEIEIELPNEATDSGNGGKGEQQAKIIFQVLGQGTKNIHIPKNKKIMSIKEARKVLTKIELSKIVDSNENTIPDAIKLVENDGIVFIDEIDKVCGNKDFSSSSADASSEGVQRDLLPLIEGSSIATKHGNVNTDHILFIASGAFHSCKPSDLLAELQGRLPIRVSLDALSEDDMYRILTEPKANLIRQQVELLATENLKLVFEDDALREISRISVEANKKVENIGARRLHALIEKIVEEISFDAATMSTTTATSDGEGGGEGINKDIPIIIDKEMVIKRLEGILETNDLSRHIL